MKNIVDDKGRLFGRISIIDALVVVVVIVLVIAAFTKFRVHDTPLASPDTVEVTYTVTIPGARITGVNLLRRGDRLFAQETGTYIGTITDIEVADAMSPEPLVDGTVVMASAEERYDVTMTIVSQGSMSGGRYFADRTYELNANVRIRMITRYYDFSGIIGTIIIG